MEKTSIGEQIKKIRIERGLTQAQLGDLCVPKMKDSAIRRYESGKVIPKTNTLQRIAKALNVSIADLDPNTFFSNWSGSIVDLFAGTGKLELLHDGSIDITKEQIEETKKRAIISLKDKYLSYFNDLNDTGKEKAIEQVELLTKIPEYKKDPGNDNQEQE